MNTESSACESMSEAISLLAAGCLPDAEVAVVRQHLAVCSSCCESFSRLQSLCQSLSIPADSDDTVELNFVTRALDVIEREPAVSPDRQRPRVAWGQLSAAIALGLLIAVAGKFFPWPATATHVAGNPVIAPISPHIGIPEDGVPTLMALRRVVDSEADLDRLLAKTYPPLQSTHWGLPE